MIGIPRICILTAGKGTRMGAYAKQLNKALMPLDSRAIISHIIERFPANAEFVIGVGYQKEQVRQYLGIAHPGRSITLVEVDNYEGPGSGPGYSLSCCRSLLQQPFYFVSCDTLWTNELPPLAEYNWLGVAQVPIAETQRYCNLRIEGDRIVELRDKERVDSSSFQAFVGLCYIHDHAVFWAALESEAVIAGERQVSNGIRALIDRCDVRPVTVEWTDVGDFEKYKRAVLHYADFDFSKSDEFFYSVAGKIIKYFVDTNLTDRRVAKAALNPEVFPTITDHAGGFYAYTYQPGNTLYQYNNRDVLTEFLQWLEAALWKPAIVEEIDMRKACREFYREKTIKRLEAYDRKYPADTQPTVINGRVIPSLKYLLAAIPWKNLSKACPVSCTGICNSTTSCTIVPPEPLSCWIGVRILPGRCPLVTCIMIWPNLEEASFSIMIISSGTFSVTRRRGITFIMISRSAIKRVTI